MDRVNTLTVLYADDEQSDRALFGIAVDKLDLEVSLRTVSTGEEALKYLRGQGQYAERSMFPLPDLIVLDLKMLGVSGTDVLRWVQTSTSLADTPVVVFTGSNKREMLNSAVQAGAVRAYEKPVGFQEWKSVVKEICELGFQLRESRC